MALLDPEHGDPDDPELIEVQLRHAEKYFRLQAATTALGIALSERQFAKVEEDLLTSSTFGYEALAWDLISLRLWTDTAEKWREALLL
jgi:hypothetical protein